MDDLMDLFKVLRKYGLKLSPHKCQFFKKKMVYMGLEFQIQRDKVCYTPLKDKCDAIMLCCSNVVQVLLILNPFQLNLEFGTTHQVQMCYTSKQV